MLSTYHNRHAASTNGSAKVQLLCDLAGRLHHEAVRYCHWKGTFNVHRILSGEGDVDLLVHRKSARRFEAAVAALGFKRAVDPVRPDPTSVAHYYGLDQASGILVHLHVYYNLVTGDPLLDDYVLPLEELLLQNTVLVDGMHVAEPAAALTVFVCRVMLAASSAGGQLVRRDKARLRATLELLLADGANAPPVALLEHWLPTVQPELFYQCLDCLRNGGSIARRLWLAQQLRRQLAGFRRLAPLAAASRFLCLLVQEGVSRLRRGRGPRKQLAAGGAVIAFVGPDASGKSTLARDTIQWLGGHFRVCSAHLGKPPATALTFLPNLARRSLRWAVPRLRAPDGPPRGDAPPTPSAGLLHRLRDVLAAWDRRALAVRLRRLAANGAIVVCDRYPSAVAGALDSYIPKPPGSAAGRFSLRDGLARLEHWLYRQVPPPDVLVHVVTPMEVALERNRLRQKGGKGESDAYIRRAHSTAVLPTFPNAWLIELDTNRPEAEALTAMRCLLWEAL